MNRPSFRTAHGPMLLVPLLVLALAAVPNVVAVGLVAQDLDGDGDVDSSDFALLRGCLSGSDIAHDGSPVCTEADIDYDGDVDMLDFGAMQECFSGAGVPGDPACGGWCVRPKADRAVGVTTNPVVTGGSTTISVGNSQVGANYQLRNHATQVNVGGPVAGNGATIYLPTGGLTSQTTFDVVATNQALGCSVQLTETRTVDVSPYSDKNKIGVHVVIGPRNGYGPFVQNCAAAGKPVAVVKCVDDFGAASQAKQYSSQTLTIGRINEMNGHDLQGLDYKVNEPPAQVAQWYYNLVKPKWIQNPAIDVWETCNEWSWHWAWQADFYIAFMDLAEADGYRLAIWSCSVGNPPEAYWSEIARSCARAKAHGGHILSLHEYGFWESLLQDSYAKYGDSLVLRYRRLYNYLIPRNADCPLALTEVGQGGGGGFVGTQLFVQDFGWYDARMREDWYVIGCAAWTLGNWSGANFQDALPALADYIVSH